MTDSCARRAGERLKSGQRVAHLAHELGTCRDQIAGDLDRRPVTQDEQVVARRVCREPRGVASMQLLRKLAELVAGVAELALSGLHRRGIRCNACGQRSLELCPHLRRGRAVMVEVESERAETDGVEPALNDRKGRALLRHEQHLASSKQTLGDHVGDRLGFARARWPLKHEAASFACPHNGALLRGVGGDGGDQGVQLGVGVGIDRCHDRGIREGLRRRVHEVVDEWMPQEGVAVDVEVLPHAERREVQEGERCGRGDIEGEAPGSDRVAHVCEHCIHVDSGPIGSRLRQGGDDEVVFATEPLDERRVRRRLGGGIERENEAPSSTHGDLYRDRMSGADASAPERSLSGQRSAPRQRKSGFMPRSSCASLHGAPWNGSRRRTSSC
ncbi:hypothetical protein A8L33_14970 (plasmid) [Microbacterium aurantiacum]|nr:hypothetical protein [Microbacterium chocolatum]ANG86872.1 hypothetical protein A8L33_14970 [Microbacterium chocolatum]